MTEIMGKPKVCVDCEHFRSTVEIPVFKNLCYKHVGHNIDLITGRPNRKYIFLAENMRDDYPNELNNNNPCGIQARFYIKKGSR